MFKTGTLLLTACLVTWPLLAQEDPKAVEKSAAVIKELTQQLQKAQAVAKAVQEAEAVARKEAEAQRERAEAALKAAEREREQALQAREEAIKLKDVAEQQRLTALKAAEVARASQAAEEAAKQAAIEALEKAKASEAAARKAAEDAKGSEPKTKQPQAERGKKRKAKFADLEQQVEALTKQVGQLQSEIDALKAHLKTGELQPGLGGKTEALKGEETFKKSATPFQKDGGKGKTIDKNADAQTKKAEQSVKEYNKAFQKQLEAGSQKKPDDTKKAPK
jgi:hypothetical protein